MASGQYLSVRSGAVTNLRATAVLTGSYVATSSVDLGSYTSVTAYMTKTISASETASLKPQWSEDNSTFYDEQVEVSGTISGTEQPFTAYSRRIDVSLAASTPDWSSRFNRQGRYFRLALKSSGTTATVKIDIQLSCLSN